MSQETATTVPAPSTNGKPNAKRKAKTKPKPAARSDAPARHPIAPDAPPPTKAALKRMSPRARAEIRAIEAEEDYKLARAQAARRLSQTATAWLADFSATLTSLVNELGRVARQAEEPGNLLAEVLDAEVLTRTLIHLEAVEMTASQLRIGGREVLDLPDLVASVRAEHRATSDATMELIDARRVLKQLKAPG